MFEYCTILNRDTDLNLYLPYICKVEKLVPYTTNYFSHNFTDAKGKFFMSSKQSHVLYLSPNFPRIQDIIVRFYLKILCMSARMKP